MDAPDPLRGGSLGVWSFTDHLPAAEARAYARGVEELGYTALWVPETTGRDPFTHLADLAAVTSTLTLATGIANIFLRHPGAMKQAALALTEQAEGRFVLGLGVSHAPVVEGLRELDHSRPLQQMVRYLDAYDASPYAGPAPVDPPRRLLAALGPRMLELAADRADGAHPYWTTPEHTEQARAVLGDAKLLCVEQKVVLTSDRQVAHAAADRELERYARLPNYRRSWHRLGFDDDAIDGRDPALIDALVAWGDADAIRTRIEEHRTAGADHVCLQPIGARDGAPDALTTLRQLAPTT